MQQSGGLLLAGWGPGDTSIFSHILWEKKQTSLVTRSKKEKTSRLAGLFILRGCEARLFCSKGGMHKRG